MRVDLSRLDIRKLARIIALFSVALALGHMVQTMAERDQQRQYRFAQTEDLPKLPDKVPLARPIGIEDQPVATTPVRAEAKMLTPLVEAPAPIPDVVKSLPVASDPCTITVDLTADSGAMIGLALRAPCHADERVVVRHAGLAVTAQTTATGWLFLALPAFETDATVQARFTDGSVVSGRVTLPDMGQIRRFGVQWQGDDAFQVFGHEKTGTISAADPGLMPVGDMPITRGFLTRLGDATASFPLLAEIYTWPSSSQSEVVIEAAVTAATCGRDILGETLAFADGAVTITELTLAMPECDAVGDFLVLNNLGSGLTLATAQ